MAGAFDGVRVLDLTEGVAGPLACMLLADLHADVVRVESRTIGGEGKRAPDPGELCWNRNKRRVELDPRQSGDGPSERAQLDALLQSADVVVFDRPDAERAEQALDAASLLRRDPRRVVVSLPHWGAPGWWSDLPVDDVLLWGLSGAAFAQFSWEDVPVELVTPQLRYAHGMLAAGAIAAALVERARSGLGQHVEVNGLHALGGLQSGAFLRALEAPRRRGIGTRGTLPNYRLYRCADGEWLFLATLIPHHFLKALDAIGLGSVLELPGVEGRFENIMQPGTARQVRDRIEARFAERDRADWLATLHEHGVPSGPVGTREAWFDSETVAANQMRVDLDDPDLGPVSIPGVPAKLHDTPGSVRHLMRTVPVEQVLSEKRPWKKGARSDARPSTGPLAGIRVLDLGVIIAAPFASALLANFGADVIKVEPLGGDSFRPYGLGFVGYNQGKRSICLDLKRPQGRETFFELVRGADVVCDNYRLGVLERLGIDHAALAAINPRIVTASITAYGTQGALAPDPGFDPLLQARSGLMHAQGGDDEPVFHQIPINDTASAMVAAFAICAALHARESSGRGQRVETSLASQSVLCQSAELTRFAGRAEAARGGRDCTGRGALQRFYACADGWVAVSCHTPGQAATLLATLGEAHDAADALGEPWDGELAARLADAIKGLEREALLGRLRGAGVPAAPVTALDEMLAHPLHRENGFFGRVDHPRFGTLHAVRSFAEFGRTPGGFARGAPELGEDGEALLRELGFDDARLSALAASGAAYLPHPPA